MPALPLYCNFTFRKSKKLHNLSRATLHPTPTDTHTQKTPNRQQWLVTTMKGIGKSTFHLSDIEWDRKIKHPFPQLPHHSAPHPHTPLALPTELDKSTIQSISFHRNGGINQRNKFYFHNTTLLLFV